MNIVLVIDQYDDGNNGTTVTARRFAHELRKLGHKVTILAGGEPAEHKICAPMHKIPIFQKLIESQGMRFAKPNEMCIRDSTRDCPTFLLQHGTEDPLVPYLESVEFDKALTMMIGEDNVTLDLIHGAKHGGTPFQSLDNIKRITDWLKQVLHIE